MFNKSLSFIMFTKIYGYFTSRFCLSQQKESSCKIIHMKFMFFMHVHFHEISTNTVSYDLLLSKKKQREKRI